MRSTIGKIVFCVVMVLGYLMVSPVFVFADNEKEVIKVGTFEIQGMISKGIDGHYEGYMVDYLDKIADRTGWEYEYVEDSWDNLLKRLEKGEFDLVCNAQYTPERAEKFEYSKFSIVEEFCVLYARDMDNRYCYNETEAFDGMRVGAIKGTYQTESFKKYCEDKGIKCTILLFKTTSEVLDALYKGYIDSAAISIQQNPVNTKIIAKFDVMPSYLIAPEGETEILDRVNKAVEEIKINSPFFENKVYYSHFKENEIESQLSLTRKELDFVQQGKIINVGIPIGRTPLSFVDDDTGELKGMMVEAIKLVEKQTDLEFNLIALEEGISPIEALKNPEYDLIYPVIDTPIYRYCDEMILSEKIMESSLGIMTLENEQFNIMDEHIIAVADDLLGTQGKIHSEYPNLQIVKMDSNVQCLNALKEGKVSAIIGNVYILNYLINSPRYEGITMVPNASIDLPSCVGIRQGAPKELVGIINKGIYSITPRDLEQIIINYTLNNHYDYSFSDYLYKNRTIILVVTLALSYIMVAFVMYNRQKMLHYKVVEKKNRELLRANKAKTEFLSRMSHEIRTPLGVIMGMNDIINQNAVINDDVKDGSDKIKTASEHLLQIINDVLDMAKISEGKMSISEGLFNLEEEIKALDTIYGTDAKKKGIEFKTQIRIPQKYFIGDILRIKQILINLLSNAIKYNKEHGKVFLNVYCLDSTKESERAKIRFVVEDTGLGIEPSSLKTIFLAFEREENYLSKKIGGTGLGLAISNEIAQLMGSSIHVESSLGKGSKFWFDLALQEATEQQIEERTAHILPKQRPTLEGKKCLVVDDNQINTFIVRKMLETEGAEVVTAENGIEACDVFARSAINEYYAILMDIRMPVMDGHEAAKYIRKLKRSDSQTVRIVALSANAFKEDKEKSLECGMNAHCSKPIVREELMEKLVL